MNIFAGKSFKDIDGKVVQLEKVAKKVTLVVNVACFCGLTRHYPGLQELQVPY
jgi:glutathione peroxidase-family protein